MVLNAGSKHQGSVAWNTEPCKSNLGSRCRFGIFLILLYMQNVACFPLLLPAAEGEGAWGETGCTHGKWDWETLTGKCSCWLFFSPEHEACLLFE